MIVININWLLKYFIVTSDVLIAKGFLVVNNPHRLFYLSIVN